MAELGVSSGSCLSFPTATATGGHRHDCWVGWPSGRAQLQQRPPPPTLSIPSLPASCGHGVPPPPPHSKAPSPSLLSHLVPLSPFLLIPVCSGVPIWNLWSWSPLRPHPSLTTACSAVQVLEPAHGMHSMSQAPWPPTLYPL